MVDHTPDDLDDNLADAPPDEPGFGSRSSKILGDLARRALMTGIGAVFMSEEALKSSLTDMKLPKEAMSYVVAQADRTKREIVAAIARETREFLSKLEVDKMLAKALLGNTIEISTRIRVLPKEDAASFQSSTESRVVLLDEADDDESRPKRSKRKRAREDS